jgi:hypothetical protein
MRTDRHDKDNVYLCQSDPQPADRIPDESIYVPSQFIPIPTLHSQQVWINESLAVVR